MTEEEAKTKWCPMVRFNIGPNDRTWQGNGYTNRGDLFEQKTCLCIASGCMMWRSIWSDSQMKYLESNGYCGLGGEP